MTLRVLQLVTQLETAGAQTMARLLDDELGRSFDTSTTFLYDKSGSDLFPRPSVLADERPRTPLQGIRFFRALLRLRRQDVDVVIAHTHFSLVLAAFLWGPRRSPAVIAVHHWPIDRYPGVVRSALRIARSTGLLAREIYVSPAIAERRDDLVIQNPVPQPGPYADTTEIEADVVVVARHAAEKDLGTAIRAMHDLPGRTLILIGGGPLTGELRELAQREGLSDRVVFAGRLSNPQVRSVLRRCRVFVLPSLWEAMPVSLLEAVAEGAVMVVSDIPAHAFLTSDSAAIGFPPGHAAGLASAIARTEDLEVRDSLIAASARVRAGLSVEAIVGQWDSVIREVAQ